MNRERLLKKQKKYIETLIKTGYTKAQLLDAFNLGYVTDEVYKHGLMLLEKKDIK